MKIHIEIRGLPKMANGGHGSWQRAHGSRKKWKTLVARELVGLAPRKPFEFCRVLFTRHSSVEPDYDGLVHGFKPLRDALVTYGFVVDDKNSNMKAEYVWAHAPAKNGYVSIDFEGIEN